MKIKAHGGRRAPLINEKIRATEMQLIMHDGSNLGVIPRSEALQLASNANLDLVIISDLGPGKPPIAKIMDFGKTEYDKKKKLALAKKKQKVIKVKEIKLRPKISENDYQTKLKQGIQFLKDGKHLKITLMFRGREMSTKEERGTHMFQKVDTTLEGQGLRNLVQEKEAKAGYTWSRIYYIKD